MNDKEFDASSFVTFGEDELNDCMNATQGGTTGKKEPLTGFMFALLISILFSASSLAIIETAAIEHSILYICQGHDKLASSDDMPTRSDQSFSSFSQLIDKMGPNKSLVFPYFNRFAPEIRTMIWEEHFLESIGGRPQFAPSGNLRTHKQNRTFSSDLSSGSFAIGWSTNGSFGQWKAEHKRGQEYSCPAFPDKWINREAADAANRVRQRLRPEIVNFHRSSFHGDVQTPVNWGRDLIFFNADVCHPLLRRLEKAEWVQKVEILAINITPQSGNEKAADVIVKLVNYLPKTREMLLVVTNDEAENGEDYLLDSDDGEEVEDEGRIGMNDTQACRGWCYEFMVRCLMEVLTRRRCGSIALLRDDFMQDIRPSSCPLAAPPMKWDDEMGDYVYYTREDVAAAIEHLETHWLDRLSGFLLSPERNIKIQWVL
ncbi:hypothetical protein J7T55_001277 [Diaporthe amygdali]|uniref:uncharacterized protein n=1 Tax=Phomopsis amygdali TaxID=1214568 RepID=UPI0022FE73E2|nr:uncharacterized protein J7T55_001277 [Diaporthe amygdali]KAJ0106753.1 hypothetical protein J7T55_001277 [Diaporthe amygdali]